jgi:phosphoglycolate phosphatase-like HAD superfamily hydrolase
MLAEGKLNRRGAIGLVSALAGVALGGYEARAEIVYNFGTTVNRELSKKASSQLTQAIPGVTAAIALAESASQGADREKANLQLRSALAQVRQARTLFEEIRKRIGKAPIDMNKVGMSKIDLDQRAERYKIKPLPQNTEALADLAILEIDRFISSTADVSFGDVLKARMGAASIGEAIDRLYQVGTMVSALADGVNQSR